MIKKDQVMPLLLEACPSFSGKWKEHLAFYEPEDETLLYLDLGEFAHHLVELHKSGSIEEFQTVFQIVDRLHLEGDHFVKEATTIGLLEDIQNVAGNTGIEPEEFLQYFGPRVNQVVASVE